MHNQQRPSKDGVSQYRNSWHTFKETMRLVFFDPVPPPKAEILKVKSFV